MSKPQLLESLKKAKFHEKIIQAFSKVKRENFIPKHLESMAYVDNALPLSHGQTISQPYTIAVMFSCLNIKKDQKVLEIGSGSGYVLALISEIVGEKGQVYGVEILRELADKSRKALRSYKNIKVYCQDGRYGLPDKSPFDRILVSAAIENIPQEILNQLKEGGVIAAPIGPLYQQSIIAYQKHINHIAKIKEIPGFVFVRFV